MGLIMHANNVNQVHGDFFQIHDCLPLEYETLDPNTALNIPDSDPGSLFGLLGELQLLEHDSHQLLRQIGERDRALMSYLKLLSKRVDLVARALGLQLAADMDTPAAVTLSEGGMTFPSPEPLKIDEWITLRLLLPTPVGLNIVAQVAHCAHIASGEYSVQISFSHLNDAQRQLLARHIIHKQAQDIRAAKHNERTSL